MEEAMARIEINSLLSVYSVPRISQVQLIFRATLADGQFGAGPESLESELFAWEKIPWNELAFPTVFWALNHFRDAEGRDAFPPFQNPE